MLYDSIKIVHIISASIVLTGMVKSAYTWLTLSENRVKILETVTMVVVLPFALLQLLTGFTMISLHHESGAQLWVKGSITCFLLAILSWLLFVFVAHKNNKRGMAEGLLGLCGLTLVCMIFFMVTKI